MRWFPSRNVKNKESAGLHKNSTDKGLLDIRKFLQEYRKEKNLAEGIGIEEDNTEDLGSLKFFKHNNTFLCWNVTVSWIYHFLNFLKGTSNKGLSVYLPPYLPI